MLRGAVTAFGADVNRIIVDRLVPNKNVIYVANTDGGEERLTDNAAYDDQPNLSPDGKRIWFVSSREGGHADLWILNISIRKVKRLTSGTAA